MKRIGILTAMMMLHTISAFAAPACVELKETAGQWRLTVNGEPFFVKGIGGQDHLETAAANGANALRTWGHDSPEEALAVLDRAHSHGLMAALGFWVQHERHGFDYNDAVAVEQQLERFKAIVDAVKDHPALLLYGIGNEVEHQSTNPKVWNAVGAMAAYVKEVDPAHPAMVCTAHVQRKAVEGILEHAPAVDLIGVNAYAGISTAAEKLREYGWDRPYLFTEWGTSGHWEVGSTDWGAPLEPTSTEKAGMFARRYDEFIAGDPDRCLGSFAFLWGVKQERTGTWYSLFDSEGRQTQAVNVLREKWSGRPAENRAPRISEILLNRQAAGGNVRCRTGRTIEARLKANDPDRDGIRYQWLLMQESRAVSSGGDYEKKPEAVVVGIEELNEAVVEFALSATGSYRLYCFLYDGRNHVSTANIPFQVQ